MRGIQSLLLVALLLALGAGVFLVLTQGGEEGSAGSVHNTSAAGRSLLYETLAELGFDVRAWDRTPSALPDGGGLLWMVDVPGRAPGYGEGDEEELEEPVATESMESGPHFDPDAPRLRDPLHYLRFVSAGGVLVLPASAEGRGFLRDTLGLEGVPELSDVPGELRVLQAFATEEEVEAVHRVLFRDGVAVEPTWNPSASFAEPAPPSAHRVVLRDGLERPLAVSVPYGAGRFLLLPPDAPLVDNENLVLPGNALLAVRLVEHALPEPDAFVAFDEYALGAWRPDSPLELAFSGAARPLSLHVLAFGLLALLAAAWVGPFPRDPERWAPVSASLRAQGLAGLFLRAGRYAALGSLLRHGVLDRLAPVRGRALPASDGEARCAPPDREDVEARLQGVLAGDSAAQRENMKQLFSERRVDGADDLERLGRDLARLERTLSTGPDIPRGAARARRRRS